VGGAIGTRNTGSPSTNPRKGGRAARRETAPANSMADFVYGGQAVIEGVMMRGPKDWAVAVRRPDQSIAVERRANGSYESRYPWLRWPLLRGVVALVEALVVGIQALTYSASQAAAEEEVHLSQRDIILTLVVALALAAGLFVLLPALLANFLAARAAGGLERNLIEGLIRMTFLGVYVVAIGRVGDIKRVFQYHGAEHKVINALEAGDDLSVDAVQKHSCHHPRCGTSFLLWVVLVAVLVFSLLGRQNIGAALVYRLLLTPVVAAISYEWLRLTGRYQRYAFWRLLAAPGRWLQGLTTRQPDDHQVEVAISALRAVFKKGESIVQ